jgi:uncharacterized OB-fold protein
VPVPDIDSFPFWEGPKRREVVILRCESCGYFVHPPSAGCSSYMPTLLATHGVCGSEFINSFAVVHRELSPGVKRSCVAAVVELKEQPERRLLTDIGNVRIGAERVGPSAKGAFDDTTNELPLPYFPSELSD